MWEGRVLREIGKMRENLIKMHYVHTWNSKIMKMIIYFQAKGNKDTFLEDLQVGSSEIICCMKFYFANET